MVKQKCNQKYSHQFQAQETVSQLILAPKDLLLFGFKVLFAFLFFLCFELLNRHPIQKPLWKRLFNYR
jgi:hypothetical protein